MFEKILLAIDESAPSFRAVTVAAAVAKRFRAEVVVLEVPAPDAHVPEPSSGTLGGAAPLVDRVVMDLKDCGVSARPEFWLAPEDDVATSMAHVVRHEAVDLIVMGDPASSRHAPQPGHETLPARLRRITRRPMLLVP